MKASGCGSGRDGLTSELPIVACLGFSRRDVAQVRHPPVMAEPQDPFERGDFDGLLALPWCPPVNQLGLVQPVDGLVQGIAVAVALATL